MPKSNEQQSTLSKNDDLNCALRAASSNPPPVQCCKCSQHWSDTTEGEHFLKTLTKVDGLDLFNDKFQQIGSTWSHVEKTKLAHWLINRSCKVGPDQSLKEVDQYILTDSFTAYYVIALSGLNVDGRIYDLDDSVALMDFASLQNSKLRDSLQKSMINANSSTTATCALVFEFDHPKEHVSNLQESNMFNLPIVTEDAEKSISNSLLCLSLVDQYGLGIQATGSTIVAKDNVPILNGSRWEPRSFKVYRGPHTSNHGVILLPENGKFVCDLIERFNHLKKSSQDKLRIPINRLASCAATDYILNVDSLIDLRIALEAVFLDETDEYQLTEKISKNIAKYLEGNGEAFSKNKAFAKRMYKLCSAAVHDGKINGTTKDGNTWKEVLRARKIVRNKIISIIE